MTHSSDVDRSQTTVMASSRRMNETGGFDYSFVKTPPREFQIKCPECKLILREPYQASCCGKSFCQVCIERIQNDDKPCPLCNTLFTTYYNKGLEGSIKQLEVYCSHKEEGCEWKGEIGQIDDHFNLSPQPDKQLEGCEYSEIECIYCSESFKRSNIAAHQNNHCPKRPFSCKYCHSYDSHYDDVVHNHWPECGYHPVPCPNECDISPQRQALEDHIQNECPNTIIDCEFRNKGCTVQLPRKDMPTHLKENIADHVSLQFNIALQRNENLQRRVAELEAQLSAQRGDLDCNLEKVDNKATANYKMLDYEFVMTKYAQHKRKRNKWYSPSFYTHPQRYQACLCIHANGTGEGQGTYVSVLVHLEKGGYDDALLWPCQGQLVVRLLPKQRGEQECTHVIYFDSAMDDAAAKRVRGLGRRSRHGKGIYKFVSHSELEEKYLINNSLCFRVSFHFGSTHIEMSV